MLQTISAIPYIGDLAEAQILSFSIPNYREEYMFRVADHLKIENINILLQNISAIPYIGGLAEAQILCFGIPTYREDYMSCRSPYNVKYKHIVMHYLSHPLFRCPCQSSNFGLRHTHL